MRVARHFVWKLQLSAPAQSAQQKERRTGGPEQPVGAVAEERQREVGEQRRWNRQVVEQEQSQGQPQQRPSQTVAQTQKRNARMALTADAPAVEKE